MKKYVSFIIGIAISAISLAGNTVYAAEERMPIQLNDEQLALVRMNCGRAQTTLDRIRKNDVLSRIYLGQEYETISYNFMAPLNNRTANTRLDGTELTKTTASFSEQLDKFHTDYSQYTRSVNDALTMKCADHPWDFYEKIIDAYNDRVELKKDITTLEAYAKQYRQQAIDLKPQLGTLEKSEK